MCGRGTNDCFEPTLLRDIENLSARRQWRCEPQSAILGKHMDQGTNDLKGNSVSAGSLVPQISTRPHNNYRWR